MNDLRSICVFCGANEGKHAYFLEAALQLAAQLVEQEIDLVYGGGSIGLMGVIAEAVNAGGREVLGIIPRSLKTKEVVGKVYGELVVVETMHERKALMAQHADAFIAMPGGFGTLDELFESITWGQLGIHQKPIGLLNVRGYFDPLLAWVDQAVDAGFVRDRHRDLFISSGDSAELIQRLRAYEAPPSVVKWLSIDQA